MPNQPGRPRKFGRASRAVALTLPENVIAWLKSIHSDPAWAIVSLFEGANNPNRTRMPGDAAEAELVQLSRRRSLIVVNPGLLRRVNGVTLLPLADGRALIALEPGKSAADLELAIMDRLEQVSTGSQEEAELTRLRLCLRRWRGLDGMTFRTRTIIVVERPQAARAVQPGLRVGRRLPLPKVDRAAARR
jgi:hypothetical protein